MHGTNTLAARPPSTRSRITNRSALVRNVDGRSAEARRFRDLIEGFVGDFGETRPSERELALVRQAAALTVQAESMQAAIVRGDPVDLAQLTRLTNLVAKLLRELGLRKRSTAKPGLAGYLAGALK